MIDSTRTAIAGILSVLDKAPELIHSCLIHLEIENDDPEFVEFQDRLRVILAEQITTNNI